MNYENKNQPITDSIDHELIEYWKKITHKPTVIVCKIFLLLHLFTIFILYFK